MYVLLEIAATSYGQGILTYTAQNIGNGDAKRIRGGLYAALLIGAATALIMSGIMVFAGGDIVGLFIKEHENGAEEMIRVGYHYLCVLSLGFTQLYWLYLFRACIQGNGDSINPMQSSMVQVFMRVMCALLLTRMVGKEGIFWGEVLAWTGADLLLSFICVKRISRIHGT